VRTRRLLERIADGLEGMDGRLEGMDGRLEGMDDRLGSIDGRFAVMLEELREQRRENQREHELTRAAILNVQEVNREILVELREHRPILERIDHGVQANTEGLMHVLDELRNGRGGPGTAPAA